MVPLTRSILWLSLVLFTPAAQAEEPMADNSHPLQLLLEAAEDRHGPYVEATIHNPTKKRVFLQIKTPEVFAVSATLTDGSGEPVEGMHTWATKAPAEISHVFREIPGGDSVPIDRFTLVDGESRAEGGGWRWDLREQRGQTLRLVFTFGQACDERTTDPPGGPMFSPSAPLPKRIKDVFCGELASAPMEIVIPAWNRANVLSTLRYEPVLAAEAYEILAGDALTHESEKVRQNAAFSLGELGRPEAATPLSALLSDPNREARGYAARALGDLKNPAVLPALEAALEVEQDSWVRGAIADAIKAIGR